MSVSVSASVSMMERFSNNWNKSKVKKTRSFDGTPFKALSMKEKALYEEFLEGIKSNNISYVDTYDEGGSCVMVYPQDNIGISCIFQCLYLNNATIELQICDAPNVDELLDGVTKKNFSDFSVYDEEYKILRSNNIQRVLSWLNQINKQTL